MTADGDVIRGLFAKKWLRACRLLAGGVTDPELRRPEEFFSSLLGFYFRVDFRLVLPHGEYVRPELARAKRLLSSHDDLVGGGLERLQRLELVTGTACVLCKQRGTGWWVYVSLWLWFVVQLRQLN